MAISKWEKLDEKRVYDGFRKVNRKTFLMPDGRREYFDVIVGEDFVGILALSKDKEVILVRQFRPGLEEIYDEIPAGIIEKFEEPLDCAKRELLEETGHVGRLEYVCSIVDCPYRNRKGYCIIARDCVKVAEPKLDKNEFIEVIKKPIPEFVEQVRSGLLTDVALSYRALDHLKLL